MDDKLEEFLSTPGDKDSLIENIQKEKDFSKPKVYISNTDKFFDGVKKHIKEDTESTEWKISATPEFHNKKLDGVFFIF